MKSYFKAKIYKVGINPCVKVPLRVTKIMEPVKGYIRIKGKINDHAFEQTLVPVKGSNYRLFVNGPMLKGSKLTVGMTGRFELEQNVSKKPAQDSTMSSDFRKQLTDENVLYEFKNLTPYRQKEILRYLYYLKSTEARIRNMKKVINQLKTGNPARIP